MMVRCEVCYRPVSMRPENEDRRVPADEGWAHRGCVEPDAAEVLLRDIFGDPGVAERRRVAADDLGAMVGHRITLDRGTSGVWWVCACGMRGAAIRAFDKSTARAQGRQHLRDAFVQTGQEG